MKDYYIYLAEERINSLYNSISNSSATKNSIELKANIGVLSGSYSHEENVSNSIQMKLETILKEITMENVFSDNSIYFKADMPMSWNADNLIAEDINATFWIGDKNSEENSYYSYARILLIGSKHNIIGNNKEKGTYCSTSYIDSFFKDIEENLNIAKYIFKGYEKDADQDLELLCSVSEQKKILCKEWIARKNELITEYIDEMNKRYIGNYSEYEFVAQILATTLSFNNKDELIKYIIASPLYVKRKKVLGNRILQTSEGKKYVLTLSEYQEHKKYAFINLSSLLKSERLVNEEEAFTSEMKNAFLNMGGDSLFESPDRKREFIEKVEPIVLKYFYIYNKK